MALHLSRTYFFDVDHDVERNVTEFLFFHAK